MHYKYQISDRAISFLIEFATPVKEVTISKLWYADIQAYRDLVEKGYITALEEDQRSDESVSVCRFTLTNQGILALAECVMYSDIDMLYDNAYRRHCKGRAAAMLSADFGYKGLRVPHHHPTLNTETMGPRCLVYFNHGLQCFTMKTLMGTVAACVSVDEMRHYEMSRMIKLHEAAADCRKQRAQSVPVRSLVER